MIATQGRLDGLPFVGRIEELQFLDRSAAVSIPSITFIHGMGGIGKSRLLDEFARRQAVRGTIIRIDCHRIEPTERGFYRELSAATGGAVTSCADVAQRLGSFGRVVLVFDDFDALRLLDSWFRSDLAPALPRNVQVICCGRDAPNAVWMQTRWSGAVRTLEVSPLPDADALALLTATGMTPSKATQVNRIARGHPLALSLAAITLQHIDDPSLEEPTFHRIVDELARRHLEDIPDQLTRRAVEAAALVRTITTPLLGAMLTDVAPSDAYERLRALPLIQLTADGLKLHDSVRNAIAHKLRSSDPERYLALRRACWGRITRDLRTAPLTDLWRYTADLLFLLQNPVVREAFFPSGTHRYAIEPAQSADAAHILAITNRHDGHEVARSMAEWFSRAPECFGVVRERDTVAGYYCLFDARSKALSEFDDPIIAKWRSHLATNPVYPNERVLFLRRWLSHADGEAPSAVQAACWLDIKRTYMLYRPHLRRVYLTVRHLAPYAAAASELGFTVINDCETTIGKDRYVSAVLDFGPRSVDGWLAKLVAAELGIAACSFLDIGARELVVGTRREALTRREFDTLHYLVQRAEEVVHRDDIISNVWGDEAEVGSNVVDVTVRALRKKLGERADIIETISGVGYRLREEALS